MEFIKVKIEELTYEQDAILRNYLISLLMPCRKGRAIDSVLGEAQALFNCVFLLDETSIPEHKEINPCLELYTHLSGVQRIFLHCVKHVLAGRTHENIELIIADARHIASFVWKPNDPNYYFPAIDPHAPL